MKKVLEVLKWVFSFTKKASLRYLANAELSDEEWKLLSEAYQAQWAKHNNKKQ